MDALPDFYDDLAACRATLWRRLAEGAEDRRSPFHNPALATVDARGHPRLRTVVLRAADPEAGVLRFHCDRRSRKASEITGNPAIALHVYDVGAKLQVRVEGTAALHTDDAVADETWAAAQTQSRVAYGVAPGPGTPLPSGGAYALPEPDGTARVGRENFCAVEVAAAGLEFLYLDRRGHRRAQWLRGEGGWTGSWLTP